MTVEKYKNSAFWIYIYSSRHLFSKILKPLLFFYYTYRVFSILKKHNPDAIITYTTLPDLPIALRSLFSRKKMTFQWYSRICFQIDRIMFLPKLTYNSNHDYFYKKIIYHALLPLMYFHIKLLVKYADCVIVINQFSQHKIRQLCDEHEHKFFLMPVCLAPNSVFDGSFDSQHLFFAAAGRLEHIKGFDFLIQTFAKFSKNNPTIKLIIYGEGSARASLLKLIQSLNLEKKVCLPGYVKNPAAISKNAIATIVPSRSEAFGKTMIEAMNARSIVIASDCVGPKEIITDKVDGLLFKAENTDELLKALNNLMNMSSENKSILKDNAYQTSLNFLPEKVAEKFNQKLERDCFAQ